MTQSAIARRLFLIQSKGITPSEGVENPDNLAHVKQQLKRAQSELSDAQAKVLDDEIPDVVQPPTP